MTFINACIQPGSSRDVDITTRLTKDITINVPCCPQQWIRDEATLAIALAREGGLGILHKNMSISQQAEQVRKVKRSESGLIIDP
jgi:IMP dehydrogenase